MRLGGISYSLVKHLRSSHFQRCPVACFSIGQSFFPVVEFCEQSRSMGRIPVSKSTTAGHSKNRSDSSTVRMSPSNSIQRKGNSRGNSTRQVPLLTAIDKENLSNQTRSSSDISDDEAMESQTTSHSGPRRTSAVHEYATKLSSNEYQCKLCPKVPTPSSSIEKLLSESGLYWGSIGFKPLIVAVLCARTRLKRRSISFSLYFW